MIGVCFHIKTLLSCVEECVRNTEEGKALKCGLIMHVGYLMQILYGIIF